MPIQREVPVLLEGSTIDVAVERSNAVVQAATVGSAAKPAGSAGGAPKVV